MSPLFWLVLLFSLSGPQEALPVPADAAATHRAWLLAELAAERNRVADPEVWSALLHGARDAADRARVLRGLGRVGDPALAPVLRAALRDEATVTDASVAEAAALAAGLLADQEALVLLRERVGPAERALALGLAGAPPQGWQAHAWLDQGAASPAGGARRSFADPVVARLIHGSRLPEPVFLEEALAVLLDPASVQARRRAALHYLVRQRERPPDAARPSLLADLGSEDPEVAGLAARALARSTGAGSAESSLLTARILDGGPRVVQVDRLRALASLPLVPARPALLEFLKCEDAHLRRSALETLAAGAGTLADVDRRGLAAFAEVIGDVDPVADVQRAALLAFAALEPERFLAALPRYRLADPWQVRAGAAEALRAFPFDASHDHAWRTFQDDPDRRVRAALLDAIGQRLEGGDPALAEPEIRAALGLLDGCLEWEKRPGSRRLVGAPRDAVLRGLLARNLRLLLAHAPPEVGIDAGQAAACLARGLAGHEAEPLFEVIDLAGASSGPEARALLTRLAHESPVRAVRARAARVLGPEAPAPVVAESDQDQEPDPGLLREVEGILSGEPVSATIVMRTGEIGLELFLDRAPGTVRNFVDLARAGAFDGILFHRVVPGFVAQAGCPRGDGWGGPGYTIPCEVTADTYERGSLGMALAGKDTGGSQWFLCHRPVPHLDGRYTLFGRVVSGFEVLDALVPGDLILRVEVQGLPGPPAVR